MQVVQFRFAGAANNITTAIDSAGGGSAGVDFGVPGPTAANGWPCFAADQGWSQGHVRFPAAAHYAQNVRTSSPPAPPPSLLPKILSAPLSWKVNVNARERMFVAESSRINLGPGQSVHTYINISAGVVQPAKNRSSTAAANATATAKSHTAQLSTLEQAFDKAVARWGVYLTTVMLVKRTSGQLPNVLEEGEGTLRDTAKVLYYLKKC